MELAIRTAMAKLGGSLLEDLLALDTGHRGPRVDCGEGHEATFVSYRGKTIDTVLGRIEYRRAYYHCADCASGVVPRDEELGVTGVSLTSGLAAMVDRVGAAVPFAKGRDLLAELAGIELSTKRVERCAEADGKAIAAAIDTHAAAIATGEVVPLGLAAPVSKLYVALDGTGIPAVPAGTAGRKGKDSDGRAHTREVKLGVVFTQTALDEEGFPVRDRDSSRYVATLEPVEHFATLIDAEARRRGSARAKEVVVLGEARCGSGTSRRNTSPERPTSSISFTRESTSATSQSCSPPCSARTGPPGSSTARTSSMRATSRRSSPQEEHSTCPPPRPAISTQHWAIFRPTRPECDTRRFATPATSSGPARSRPATRP